MNRSLRAEGRSGSVLVAWAVVLGCRVTTIQISEIPEDPLVAEAYYADTFDSCSEESEGQEEEAARTEGPPPAPGTHQQDSDIAALVRCLEDALSCTSLDTETTTTAAADVTPAPTVFHSAMATARMKSIRESAMRRLGAEAFEEVYRYLRRARQRGASEPEVLQSLGRLVPRVGDCFEVDQLLYFEEQLLSTAGRGHRRPSSEPLSAKAGAQRAVVGQRDPRGSTRGARVPTARPPGGEWTPRETLLGDSHKNQQSNF